MALKLALIGSTTVLVGYSTYKYMSKPNPSIYTSKPFYDEALILTRGYKPITEKLIEPIQPLKIDTSNSFNTLTLLGAQVNFAIMIDSFIEFHLGSNSSSRYSKIGYSLLLCYARFTG